MYIGASINESRTVVGVTGAAITAGAGKAVKYDVNGAFVLAAAGEEAYGILLIDSSDDLASGDEVTVQIKDIGTAIAGAPIAKGAAVTANAAGKLITAVAATFSVVGAVATIAGKNYILGYANSAATGDGSMFEIDITKSGYKL